MERSLEEARALAEVERLRQVVDRLRSLAAATVAELEGNSRRSSEEPASALDPPGEG